MASSKKSISDTKAVAGAVGYSTPEESSSKPAVDHVEVEMASGIVEDNKVVENVGRNDKHVVLNIIEELQKLDEDVELEISVRRRRRQVITSNYYNLSQLVQLAFQFCVQLGAVFLGNALSKSLSSCAASASAEWIAITVTLTYLIGFVFTLIALAMSLQENKNSTPAGGLPGPGPAPPPPRKKRTIFSVVAKFGFAGFASTLIISMGTALSLNTIGMIAVTAIAIFLPFFIALVRP
ncbi:hypothetical protein ACH5RR_036025 [Cinchona calisaya]|uniref:Uncharacterized protein n=1 Tax=Cinchona calisaya TaxID=153742 RepID=A0ABD2Y202_9GENT